MIVKLGEHLGYGGFAYVYRGLDPEDSTPLAIAIKRSRVSQRTRRPTLQHEANVLRALMNHPNIPRIFAYGHLPHFEYMAMELLGNNLEQVTPTHGMNQEIVARIAVQLLSVLEFVHSRGLIHRDIKPTNILLSLDEPPTLRLIDFGIARPFKVGVPTRRDSTQPMYHIPGTLHWVSLNAHLGYEASRRDDLESLAYTVLFLLRGNLPWQHYKGQSGTRAGYIKLVREKKKQWSGRRLGQGMAMEFGELLDYSRALGFDAKPDYQDLTAGFRRLAGNSVVLDSPFLANPASSSCSFPKPQPLTGPPPVSSGRLVYVKLLPRPTIEGCTAQALDSSHWEDMSLAGPEWETKMWPAVVLNVVDGAYYWRVKVLPLKRCVREMVDGDAVKVSPLSTQTREWLWGDIAAFGCPTVETFTCLPDQPVLAQSQWSLSAQTCAALSKQFDRRPRSNTSRDEDLRIRIDDKLSGNVYVALSALGDPFTQGDGVEWGGARGWLDEMEKIVRKRVLDNMREWSTQRSEADEGANTDSNSDPCYTEWWPLLSRELSVTFSKDTDENEWLYGGIERIEHVIRKVL